jgi:PBP1b-binding outer membrane lipoprotein LpoB
MQTTIPIAAVIAAAVLFSGCGTATNDRAASSPTQPAAAETPSPDLSTSAFRGVKYLDEKDIEAKQRQEAAFYEERAAKAR